MEHKYTLTVIIIPIGCDGTQALHSKSKNL